MTKEMIRQIENDYWEEKADQIDMAEVFDLAELAIKALEQQPSEEQEPKIGHWVVISSENGKYICECSECKDEVWFKDVGRKWNYCSNCGARMIESEGEE